MSSDDQVVAVRLRRGTTSTPWGFRMQGGNEYGSTLYIQKINPKSLAYRQGLRGGDRLVAIGDRQTHNMSHEAAKMEIIRAGNELDLLVQRSGNVHTPVDHIDAGHHVPKYSHPSEEPTEYRGYTNPNVQSRSFKILQESLSYSEANEEGIVLPSGHTPGEEVVLRAYGEGKRRMEELMEINPRNFTSDGESPYRYASPRIREEDETRLKRSGSRRRRQQQPEAAASAPAVAKTYGSVNDAPRQIPVPAVDIASSSVFAPAAAQQQYIQQAQENYHQKPHKKPLMLVNHKFEDQYGHMRREPGSLSPVAPQPLQPAVQQQQNTSPQQLSIHPQHLDERSINVQPEPRRRQRTNPPQHHMQQGHQIQTHIMPSQKVISPSVSAPRSPSFIPTTQTVSSVAADLDLKHEGFSETKPTTTVASTDVSTLRKEMQEKPDDVIILKQHEPVSDEKPAEPVNNAVNVVAEKVVSAAMSEAKTEVTHTASKENVAKTDLNKEVKETESILKQAKAIPVKDEVKTVPVKEEPKAEPVQEDPKPEQVNKETRPEPIKEETKPEPVKEEKKPEPVKEETKSEPVKEETKPEPVMEEMKPEPVKEETKPEPVKEETKPEPVKEETKPEPVKEETKQEPVKEETKPEPVKEETKPEPVKEETKPEPVKEETKPEPVKEEKKPEPVKEETKQEPIKEETKPEPVKEEKKPEPVKEETKSEPVKEETKPEPVMEEMKPEPVKEETKPEPVKEETKPEPVKEETKPEPVKEELKPEPVKEEPKEVPMPTPTEQTEPVPAKEKTAMLKNEDSKLEAAKSASVIEVVEQDSAPAKEPPAPEPLKENALKPEETPKPEEAPQTETTEHVEETETVSISFDSDVVEETINIDTDENATIELDIQTDVVFDDGSNTADEVTLILDAEALVDDVKANDASDGASEAPKESASTQSNVTKETDNTPKNQRQLPEKPAGKSVPRVFDSQGGVSARLAKFGLKK